MSETGEAAATPVRNGLSGAAQASYIEDADATRADQQADDDEDDAPEDLPPEQREDAGDHEDNGENPKQ
ncbi:hypothetical protein ACTI_31130 [Actinoplanes sp. OR16]|nr:hypothetical protein ACTI_31130 [Actinoplanes sp. OR16]